MKYLQEWMKEMSIRDQIPSYSRMVNPDSKGILRADKWTLVFIIMN